MSQIACILDEFGFCDITNSISSYQNPGRIHGIVKLICDIKIVFFIISHNDNLKSHIQILDYVLV